MQMEDYILSVFTNFFRVLIIMRFMRIFFVSKIERRSEMVAYLAYLTFVLAVFFRFQYPLYNILANWGGLLILTHLYEGNRKKKVFIGTIIYAVNMACDVFAAYLFSDYMVGDSISQIFSIFTTLFLYICEIIVEKVVKEKGRVDLKFNNLIMLFVPIISGVMLWSLIEANLRNRVLLMVQGCGILGVNILLCMVYYQMAITYEKQLMQEHMEEQMRMYKNELEVMRLSEQKVQALRHDMKYHMQKIYAMTENGQREKVLQCITDMQSSLNNPKRHVATGNEDVDTTLNYLLEKGEKAEVKITCKVNISQYFTMENYALNILLGNLLDNAIEAARQSEEKMIDLHMLGEKDMLVVQIKNSYNGKIRKRGKQLLSTKGEQGHGIGLTNVRNLVESKDGRLKFRYDEKTFWVEAILYL